MDKLEPFTKRKVPKKTLGKNQQQRSKNKIPDKKKVLEKTVYKE